MQFYILTLFPEMIETIMGTSILGRAKDRELISLEAVNIRDFAFNKHRQVDDYPYGGGAGMLMQCEPIHLAFASIEERLSFRPRLLYMTPQGKPFTQEMAKELAWEDALVFLCGHYEGVDERVLELLHAELVSVGDYVLTGGELPAMVMVDAISRLVDGVLHNGESAREESFENHLLEGPQYTRPTMYQGISVPEVLLSGNHSRIKEWQKSQSILRTLRRRPDLLEKADLDSKEKKLLEQYKQADR